MNFSPAQIQELNKSYCMITAQYVDLIKSYGSKNFINKQAKEYATHGLMRRIQTLIRCIHNVYEIFPPERSERLSEDELSDLVINLQCFIFNVFGCLDNLAWIWVKEKKVTNEKDKTLKKEEIGLGKKYKCVRESFSEKLQNHLKKLDKWFSSLENYRHSLAHRIPLYVPPNQVNNKEADRILELVRLQNEALKKVNLNQLERISVELASVGKPCFYMLHSFEEPSREVVFHAQIIADWRTIVEISDKLFEELESIPEIH